MKIGKNKNKSKKCCKRECYYKYYAIVNIFAAHTCFLLNNFESAKKKKTDWAIT